MDPKIIYRPEIPTIPSNEKRPLWSVMIPTYNCADYLRETLTSVLIQDLGTELMQIEVVDDYSTLDDPLSVVNELGRGRVGFFRQRQNVGMIRNFETSLKRSRGRLIHQLHGDDCVRFGFYKKMQESFDKHPEIGAAFCRYIIMDLDGHWQNISELIRPKSDVLENWLEIISRPLHPPVVVVRREVYEEIGGFDTRINYCGEDWEMWVRIATKYPVSYEVEPLALYRFKPLHTLEIEHIRNIMSDMRVATNIVESYLPNYLPASKAKKCLSKYKETYALWPLPTTYHKLAKGELINSFILIQEMLKCSHSFLTILRIVYAFLKHGSKFFKLSTSQHS